MKFNNYIYLLVYSKNTKRKQYFYIPSEINKRRREEKRKLEKCWGEKRGGEVREEVEGEEKHTCYIWTSMFLL